MYTTKHLYFKDWHLYQEVMKWCKKLDVNFSQMVIDALRDKIRRLQGRGEDAVDAREILRLPLKERRKLLARQATPLRHYYAGLDDLETGDFPKYE